jgi:hypothetical protein
MFSVENYSYAQAAQIMRRVYEPFSVLKDFTTVTEDPAEEINSSYRYLCSLFEEYERRKMTIREHVVLMQDLLESRVDVVVECRDHPREKKLSEFDATTDIVCISNMSYLHFINDDILGHPIRQFDGNRVKLYWE